MIVVRCSSTWTCRGIVTWCCYEECDIEKTFNHVWTYYSEQFPGHGNRSTSTRVLPRVSPKPLPRSFYTRHSCRPLLPSCLYRSLYCPVLFRLRLIYHDIYDCWRNIAHSLLYLCGLDPLSKEEAYIASLVLLRITVYLNICILCSNLFDGYSNDVFMHRSLFSTCLASNPRPCEWRCEWVSKRSDEHHSFWGVSNGCDSSTCKCLFI
jgi:hypothetical protein